MKKKKGEQKLALSFFLREKKWRLLAQVSRTSDHDSSVSCELHHPRRVEQMSFPWSALQISLYDVRITTKISTTCTYYREILSLQALRSSRTTEYYVLLNLQ